jgi:putative flippase GtrA
MQNMKSKKEIFEALRYVIWGVLTALINVIFYYCFTRFMHMHTVLSTALAWLVANLFAFWVNKVFVFKLNSYARLSTLLFSCFYFLLSRLISGLCDTLAMFYFVDVLHCKDMVIKVTVGAFLGILNYILGKTIFFKKREE